MIPARLKRNDTICLIAPCNVAQPSKYTAFIAGLEHMGFRVKTSKHLYAQGYGYAATKQQRLDDLIDALLDEEVKMILFGGGQAGNEFLKDLDYSLFIKHPKIIASYSNGTALLNAITLNSGLEVYYGQFPGVFANISAFDRQHFEAMFLEKTDSFLKCNPWQSITEKEAEGILIGGYTDLVALLLNNPFYLRDPNQRYLLFLENHEKFQTAGTICSHLAWIEQSPWIDQISGLLFGCFSPIENSILMDGLERFGLSHNIPVLYCNDFGHGDHHGILPIGRKATLSSKRKELRYDPF